MADPWPNTGGNALPDTFDVQGYSEELADNVIYSQPEAGLSIARKRFSAMPVSIKGNMVLSLGQKTNLTNFYNAQTGLRFSWTNDIRLSLRYYLFNGPLKYTPISGNNFRVSLSLLEFETEAGGY